MDETPQQEVDIAEKVGAIDSVVHQTFADQTDIGEVVDKIDGKTDDIPKLRKEFYAFKQEVKKQITVELQSQMKPFNEKLDKFLTTKQKTVYIVPKLSNPIKWFFKLAFKNA